MAEDAARQTICDVSDDLPALDCPARGALSRAALLAPAPAARPCGKEACRCPSAARSSPHLLPRVGTTPIAVTIRGQVRVAHRRAAALAAADRDRSQPPRRARTRGPARLPAGTPARLEHRSGARSRAAPPWSAKAGSAASSSSPNRRRRPSAAGSSPSTARLPDGRPGDPRPPLHPPAGAADLRPRLRARPRPRHLRHPPRRHRPGEDPAHRPHHLLLPAPAPHLHRRRRTPQLPQRRLPGPGRLPQRHLPPGPHLLRLRRREDRLRHPGAHLPGRRRRRGIPNNR